ncbi:hypothetical protein BB560_001169 [Smittium megazygosporum]|uniref:mannose-1-phosphate guanylyltransferase n=1 Tax=Smittium megazygosporum TaxID=133381 RepID=A0A2T9ZIA8_9FUNG|nr:hypothetical protein BB560_001169 [Smittium megazygosporum]
MNKAVILVGGPSRATRFRPLSMNMPQPLFPVGGKPIIWHQVNKISSVPGIKEIILLGVFEEHVFQSFLDQCSIEYPNISFKYLREYTLLGTAGGLFHFRDVIKRGNPTNIFLLYTDICSSFPLTELLEKHEQTKSMGTIMVKKVPKSNHSKFGYVVADSNKDMALHYVEKPETYISDLVSTGVYVFSPKIFDLMADIIEQRSAEINSLSKKAFREDFEETPDFLRLEQDILQHMASNKQLGIYITTGFWRQIKSAASAVPANEEYLKHAKSSGSNLIAKETRDGPTIIGAVYIHPSATIDPTAKIGPNVSIQARANIGAGVRVKNAIILDNVNISDNAVVINSIVGWNSKLWPWARVEGSPCTDQNENTVAYPDASAFSICILGQDTHVRNEVFVRSCIVLPYKEISSDQHNLILM